MEFLRFIFSSFWIWLGFLMLLSTTGKSIGAIIGKIQRTNISEKRNMKRGWLQEDISSLFYGPGTKEIARYVIEQVQKESTLSGFQYIVSYAAVEKKFNITMNDRIINVIVGSLEEQEEVADVQLDECGFDVVLYTDYTPNYVEHAE